MKEVSVKPLRSQGDYIFRNQFYSVCLNLFFYLLVKFTRRNELSFLTKLRKNTKFLTFEILSFDGLHRVIFILYSLVTSIFGTT